MQGILDEIYNPKHLVVDVRSPSEFEHGHVPGAVSIALFTDEERAAVGTAYAHEGKDKAIGFGLDVVGPRMNEYIAQVREHLARTQADDVIMYCWRGGMRSASMAWLFRTVDIHVTTIEHGYKAYRHAVLDALERPWKLVVIGGRTGTGKTHIIRALRERGEQVIDLEHIANHRGSSFGALGLPPQPTSEHAMNLVHKELMHFDASRRIFIEDESHAIGTVALHEPFFRSILHAPRFIIDLPTEVRVGMLVEEYGSQPSTDITESFQRIGKKLGGARLKAALAAYNKGEKALAVELALQYYDSTYDYALKQRSDTVKAKLAANAFDANVLADRVIATADRYFA